MLRWYIMKTTLASIWQNISSVFSQAGDNLSFLGICLLVFVGMFALAKLAEKTLLRDRLRRISGARKAAFIGVFAAVAGLLMFLEIPLPFAPAFYEIDLSEIPIMMAGFYLGPVAGVVTELLKQFVKLMLKGTSTAFVGDLANFLVGCSFVLPATIIYHIRKTKKSALIGLISGTAVMTVFGSLFNAVYLLPAFSKLYGMPLKAIVGMGSAVNPAINSITTLVLFAVVPFNLIKGVMITVITMLLYKRVAKLLKLSETPVRAPIGAD